MNRHFLTRRMSAFGMVAAILLAGCSSLRLRSESVTLVVDADAAPRVAYGADQLAKALETLGRPVRRASTSGRFFGGSQIVIGNLQKSAALRGLIEHGRLAVKQDAIGPEGFVLATAGNGAVAVAGSDDSGALYGCLELADRIARQKGLPRELRVAQTPAFRLRGTCIGMQKPGLLPGRGIYEYPYTPENFPFFYDQQQWREYLDYLCANRMNTLYLWNGHPFASLVKLDDYPYAVEVSDEVFRKNVEMYRYLTEEAGRRGIWVVQMFYNVYVSKPFAERNQVRTQMNNWTPIVADYNRKSIAKFVEQYPNVGLMPCLGEALKGPENQQKWLNEVIIPGVKDGMARLGLKEEPPIVVRAHSIGDPKALIQKALPLYKNLYTESKFNGESLTTWEPLGKWLRIHRGLSESGAMHVVNVHLLSNLEPFRYGATDFIRKSVLSMRDSLHARGLHLYPLAYWNWPDSSDKTDPPLIQYKRDWIWFEAWGRYAWNPDRDPKADHAYWVDRLAEKYGTREAGEKILAAYNDSGECAPRLLRRFGITEGNRQTLSLGMMLDQLVNAPKYGEIPDLWESPPGERLNTYAERDWQGLAHEGETPPSAIQDVEGFSKKAVEEIEAAAPRVTANRAEFERLRNDVRCIREMSLFYGAKARAAMLVLRHQFSGDPADVEKAVPYMEESVEHFRKLTELTSDTYRFANTLQIGHRKIPMPGASGRRPIYYHWTQMLPVYEKELTDFERQAAQWKSMANGAPARADEAGIQPLARAPFRLVGGDGEVYDVKPGATAFKDRDVAIADLAPELTGLQGIRLSLEAATKGKAAMLELETDEPVKVLVGYFKDPRKMWLQVPNTDVDAAADSEGGVETQIENAATIQNCPAVDIHAFRYDKGRHTLDLRGKGSYVVLGVVPATAKIARRDAGRPAGDTVPSQSKAAPAPSRGK